VLVLLPSVVPTGLPVASTGLFEVWAWDTPAVLDRLGAVLPELACAVLLGGLTDLAGVPAGVVCTRAVEGSVPATAKAVKIVLIMLVN
jgi:hypothetical protein